MKIDRVSAITGKKHSLEIDITEEQYQRWERGEYIQDVCPHLTTDEREFILSGATKEEWEEFFEGKAMNASNFGKDIN